ncbi:MAG: glycosyltransferase family 4 protein [Steroidobacteraceae bacterium]
MRIAIMLRTLDERGGIAVYSANLVAAMLDCDTVNEYLLLYRNPAHLGRFGGRANVAERVLAGRSKAVWDQLTVPRTCRRHDVDVVVHPKFTVPLLGGVPSVMVLHGADWFLPEAAHFYTRLDRLYMRIFMPLYLRSAAGIISVSRLTTGDFERIFKLPKGRITTVYFGPARHFRRITDTDAIAAVKRRYGLPDRFILTLSKVGGGDRKNIRGVFAAFARLHGRVPHKLVVGGQGCERFRDDYAIPDAGWGRDVVFAGWLDQNDLPAVYSASDLFLYPSNQEAFPIPITEAMTCGTPIVTSKANGLEEIAGDAALLIDPRNTEAIAAAACDVLTDASLAARLQKAGLLRSRLFSWDACARNTLAVVEQAAAQGRRGRTQGSSVQ